MKYFYISEKNSNSGISRYANDFYEFILKEKEYEFIDSREPFEDIFKMAKLTDRIHLEIGIFETNTLALLIKLLRMGYTNIAITMHDPPLLKYPFHQFRNPFVNKISKFFDIHITKFKQGSKYIHKIKKIYVLSEKGAQAVRKTYNAANVCYLPHIVETNMNYKSRLSGKNLIYLGLSAKIRA